MEKEEEVCEKSFKDKCVNVQEEVCITFEEEVSALLVFVHC